jgi:hypothetical protein
MMGKDMQYSKSQLKVDYIGILEEPKIYSLCKTLFEVRGLQNHCDIEAIKLIV